MRGIFWNSRSLADLAKRRFLADMSRELKLDFMSLLETGRDNFTSQFLGTISHGLDYDWHFLSPQGRSRGILLGVNCETLEVGKVTLGEFVVEFQVRSKVDGFGWALVAIDTSQTYRVFQTLLLLFWPHSCMI